ncbi:MAG: SpoIIE family protein phosphatase [Leptospiraceae bacterium]|nr:SpoIIE family protein phosphatase [Leptospiraceae bacterium]
MSEKISIQSRLENLFHSLFDTKLEFEELYSKTLKLFVENFSVEKVGIGTRDPLNQIYRMAAYKGIDRKDKIMTKVTVSESDLDIPFLKAIEKGESFIVDHFADEKKDVRFYKYYSTISGCRYSFVIPIHYEKEILGTISFDFEDEKKLGEFLSYKEDAEFIAKLFAVSLKNSLLFQSNKTRYIQYKDLHNSSLTLNQLYLNNTQEIVRMSLLTMSGLLSTDFHILVIYNSKYKSLSVYRLLKGISGLELDHLTEELEEYKQHLELLTLQRPLILTGKEIQITRKLGFTGTELLVLPGFELEGNQYAFLLGRNSTRRFDPAEIELLDAFSELAKMRIDNAFMFHKMTNQERLEKEIEIAKDIQLNLLPRNVPISDLFEFSGFMLPAREIGGDYYDFMQSPDKKETIVAIGDVSGKGLPAGMVMATARTIIHSYIRKKPSLSELISELNSYLYYNYKNSVILRFMSMTILRIDHVNDEIEFMGAGHGHMLVYRKETDSVEIIETGGTILGIVPELPSIVYEPRPKLYLKTGDSLLLCTDGATEVTNIHEEQFEEKGVLEILKKNANLNSKDLLQKIYEEIRKFSGASSLSDDITLVSIKKK